jgi:hypothetical protein
MSLFSNMLQKYNNKKTLIIKAFFNFKSTGTIFLFFYNLSHKDCNK